MPPTQPVPPNAAQATERLLTEWLPGLMTLVCLCALLAGPTCARAADGTAEPALAAAAASAAPSNTPPALSGEFRLRLDQRAEADRGPLAAANQLSPGTAPPAPDSLLAEAELRGRWHRGAASLQANLLASAQHAIGAASGSRSAQGLRVNELHLSLDGGAWQASAGKKLVEWDVGYGFRPNDVVQQLERRSLATATAEGRPLLQLEHFSADDAFSLVWANPQRWSSDMAHSRDGDESALAARWYHRAGALDAHGFARWGRHTHASLGAALAWVATDALALHASARWLGRHEAWHTTATGAPLASTGAGLLASANPWQRGWQGRAVQALVGAQWTGAQQQSLLVEYWHDGTALSRADWRAWSARNAALWAASQQPSRVPASAWAGNLAWQSSPWSNPNLQRDNLFVRLAWQPEAWQLSLDALLHPADRGRIVTAALQWQGDAWRLNASWRVYGGPADAVLAQLPTRQQVVLVATRSF